MKLTGNSLYRAFRTFIQSALAYIIVNVYLIDFTDTEKAVKSAISGLIISAIAAGLSAIMNLEDTANDNG